MTANRGNSEDRCECGGEWEGVYGHMFVPQYVEGTQVATPVYPTGYKCSKCHKPREGGEEG